MSARFQPPRPPEPLWLEPHDAPTFAACDRRPRVLVVEDNPVQALLLTLMLKHLGVDTMLVTDGEQAVDAVRAGRFALVLMDYLMPGLNGVEATRLIRRWEREAGRTPLPIVAVTASAMRSECESYTAAGMNAVILKPFSAQSLAGVLAHHGVTSNSDLVHGAVS